jgi:asparagine synthase (glutamine-hydrolysing)
MCGIAGWVDRERDLARERGTIVAMTRTLACRGPDDEGVWIAGRVALGHRRLAVVDLPGGRQPMRATDAGGSEHALTFSGEIYGHAALRTELEAHGHVFTTRSDTEVLLRAMMEWGDRALARLDGMFAFAAWDGRRRELVLARDRLGIKPLYYAEIPGGLVFGSEPKALLAHPEVPPEVGDEGLAEIFAMGPMRTPGEGVFRRVRELRPGFFLRYGAGGARLARYWQLESHAHTDDEDTTVARVRELVEGAVRRQLVADVPVCTLLSGGLDSSAVTAIAARALAEEGRGPVDSFSVDLAGEEEHFEASAIQPDRDPPWVAKVVAATGARHRDIVVTTPEILEALAAPVVARDLPSLGDVDATLYLLCKAIKRTHTVAVSGESADEVFGGYPWFHDPEAVASDDFPWASSADLGASDFLAPDLAARLRPRDYARARLDEALAEVPRLGGESAHEARMREILYLNQTRFLPMLLDRKDRMSMAVGLEVRVPFCDHHLVEYVWNIPWSMKAARNREKGLLRLALEGFLPEDVLWRRKSAYPVTHDPAYSEAIRARLEAVVDDPTSPLRALVDVTRVRAAIADPARGAPGFRSPVRVLAYLASVDAWMRERRVRVV